jgi:hypothetical protein
VFFREVKKKDFSREKRSRSIGETMEYLRRPKKIINFFFLVLQNFNFESKKGNDFNYHRAKSGFFLVQ